MTATASNLSALRTAALAGDRVAMLCLADVAEERGEDDRADVWRWLADPPAEGWEQRAWGIIFSRPSLYISPDGADEVWLVRHGLEVRRLSSDTVTAVWDRPSDRWLLRTVRRGILADNSLPGWVRPAVLAASRRALAG
jgi:hypothetical protein